MGNCLVLQASAVVKIMKTDGKVLEYKAPIEVQQVLSEYSGHVISDSIPVLQQLQPITRLTGGQLYYLVPQPPKTSRPRKKVRFSNPEVESEENSSAVRVKLVISKQQLHEMLQKGGISFGDIVSQFKSKKETDAENMLKSSDGCQVRKPALESIPEAN